MKWKSKGLPVLATMDSACSKTVSIGVIDVGRLGQLDSAYDLDPVDSASGYSVQTAIGGSAMMLSNGMSNWNTQEPGTGHNSTNDIVGCLPLGGHADDQQYQTDSPQKCDPRADPLYSTATHTDAYSTEQSAIFQGCGEANPTVLNEYSWSGPKHTVLSEDSWASTEHTVLSEDSRANSEHTVLTEDFRASIEHTVLSEDSRASTEHTVLSEDIRASPEHTVLNDNCRTSPKPTVLSEDSRISTKSTVWSEDSRNTRSPHGPAPPSEVDQNVARITENANETATTYKPIHQEPTRCSKRSRKRPLAPDSRHVTCPSCSLSLKPEELAGHVQTEMNKLDKLNKYRKHSASYNKAGASKVQASDGNPDTEVMDAQARYKSYLKIRTRRERRLRAKRKPGPGEEQTKCPVCDEVITGTADELAEHVDQCLVQQEECGDELDVEGEEDDPGFEEYTWAGQTRIRASSLLEGGLAASGFQVTSVASQEDQDVDLDIDGDDSNMYGDVQYTEADLLPCNSEEPGEEKERKALRNAVLRGEGCRVSRSIPCDRQRWKSVSSQSEDKRIQKDCEKNGSPSPTGEVVASLKAKLRDQETQLENLDRPKCLICMDCYTKPLTSVQCWHVHCEECWLRTLGAKKLCPQCNTITSPADLRRIYL